MMENWLVPNHPDRFGNYQNTSLGKFIKQYGRESSDLSSFRVALIGWDAASHEIRNELFQMENHFSDVPIIDMGILRKQKADGLIQVMADLLSAGILPVLVGGPIELTQLLYKSYKFKNQAINLCVLSRHIPYAMQGLVENRMFLNEILESKDRFLFHTSLIGYQRHYNPLAVLTEMEKRDIECMSLGELKGNVQRAEPLIRDADHVSIDIDAVCAATAPGQLKASNSGLELHETCQLMRYAGYSEKIKSFCITGYREEKDRQSLTANLIAQMLWYFFEGVSQRKYDHPFDTKNLTEFIVDVEGLDSDLTFWKSKVSNRWWMQIPFIAQEKLQRHQLIPCSYEDYLLACKNEVPERLLMAFRRFT